MNEIDEELLFTHDFTTDNAFQSKFDKLKVFRVMDADGKITNTGGYHNLIPVDKIKKIYETMVTINEADIVFNQA